MSATLFLVALIVLALGVVVLLFRRPVRPTIIFCPTHERVVEMTGDTCRSVDDGWVVGSPRNCQRECFLDREAAVWQGRGSRGKA